MSPQSDVKQKLGSSGNRNPEREMAEASSVVPAEGGGDDTAKVILFHGLLAFISDFLAD
jgi:hypothetical protein